MSAHPPRTRAQRRAATARKAKAHPYPTPRQWEAFDFISAYLSQHGRAPLLTEIAAGLGVAAHSGAQRLVGELIRKGVLARPRPGWRSLAFPKMSHPHETSAGFLSAGA